MASDRRKSKSALEVFKATGKTSQTSEGSQVIVEILEAFGKLAGPRQRVACSANDALGEHQRHPESSLQHHFMARSPTRGIKVIEALAHPVVTFGQQLHMKPDRRRSRRQRQTDRGVAAGTESPGESGTNVVDLGRVSGGGIIS